jgi:hypothetical protein
MRWKAHLESSAEGEHGLCIDLSEFSDHVVDLIKTDHTDELKVIFDLVEDLIVSGDAQVRDAITTCFLENLLNAVSPTGIPASAFVAFLGPNAREFCRAWDKFTGVQTEGL